MKRRERRKPTPRLAPTPDEKKGEAQTNAPTASKMVYHTVTAGDTYYNISKRYNLELEQLLEMNGLKKESILKPGQKLVVRILGEK